jgi:hypothetical protein
MNTFKRILLSPDVAEGVEIDSSEPGDNQQTIVDSNTGKAVELSSADLNEPIGDEIDSDEVAAPPVKSSTTAEPTPTPTVTPPASSSRDYSFLKDFPDDEKIFRAASPNPIFNWAKQRLPELYGAYKERETLKQQLEEFKRTTQPQTFAEHPQAYILNPEYEKAQTNYALVSEEEEHWLTQLKNVRQGKPWQDITGRDAQGRLVKSAPIDIETEEARVNADIQLAQLLNQAGQYKQQFANQANGIRQQHTQLYQQETQRVQDELKKYFPSTYYEFQVYCIDRFF